MNSWPNNVLEEKWRQAKISMLRTKITYFNEKIQKFGGHLGFFKSQNT